MRKLPLDRIENTYEFDPHRRIESRTITFHAHRDTRKEHAAEMWTVEIDGKDYFTSRLSTYTKDIFTFMRYFPDTLRELKREEEAKG